MVSTWCWSVVSEHNSGGGHDITALLCLLEPPAETPLWESRWDVASKLLSSNVFLWSNMRTHRTRVTRPYHCGVADQLPHPALLKRSSPASSVGSGYMKGSYFLHSSNMVPLMRVLPTKLELSDMFQDLDHSFKKINIYIVLQPPAHRGL